MLGIFSLVDSYTCLNITENLFYFLDQNFGINIKIMYIFKKKKLFKLYKVD
jgi:hypothetical protein